MEGFELGQDVAGEGYGDVWVRGYTLVLIGWFIVRWANPRSRAEHRLRLVGLPVAVAPPSPAYDDAGAAR
jgi:hypothetical protein